MKLNVPLIPSKLYFPATIFKMLCSARKTSMKLNVPLIPSRLDDRTQVLLPFCIAILVIFPE